MDIRVCYFGAYNRTYPRNSILRKGLTLNGVKVVECQVSNRVRMHRSAPMLVRKYRALHRDCDVVLLAEVNQLLAPLAWLLARLTGKPLVSDPFFSLYDSLVFDRQLAVPTSLRARRYYLTDKLAMFLPDALLADTEQHLRYYVSTFGSAREKFHVIPIGADDEIFFLQKAQASDQRYNVLFFGSYIPLHGVHVILRAAELLKDSKKHLQFTLVGSGQTYDEMRELAEKLDLQNIRFVEKVPQNQVPKWIAQSDLVLGIFGCTDKAQRVVPHKVFQGLAMRKPVLTGDSPAIRELFVSGEHLLTCEMGDPEALAGAILSLQCDLHLRARIAEGGYRLVKERFTPQPLGRALTTVLQIVLGG